MNRWVFGAILATASLGIASATSNAAPLFQERFDSPASIGATGSFTILHDNRHSDLSPNTYFDVADGALRLAQQDKRGPSAVGTNSKFTLGADGGVAVRLTTAPAIDPLPASVFDPDFDGDAGTAANINENRRFLFSIFFTDGFGTFAGDPDIGAIDGGTGLSNRDAQSRFEIGLRAGVNASTASPGSVPAPAPIEVFGRGSGVQTASVVSTTRAIEYGEEIVLALGVSGGTLSLSVYDSSLALLGQTLVSGAFSFADEADGRVVFSQSGGRHVQFVTVDEVVLASDANAAQFLSVVPAPATAALMLGGLALAARRRS